MCMCVTVCMCVSQDYRKRYVVLDHSSLKMYRKETVSCLSAVDTQDMKHVHNFTYACTRIHVVHL